MIMYILQAVFSYRPREGLGYIPSLHPVPPQSGDSDALLGVELQEGGG